jgi:hypothetical protein
MNIVGVAEEETNTDELAAIEAGNIVATENILIEDIKNETIRDTKGINSKKEIESRKDVITEKSIPSRIEK